MKNLSKQNKILVALGITIFVIIFLKILFADPDSDSGMASVSDSSGRSMAEIAPEKSYGMEGGATSDLMGTDSAPEEAPVQGDAVLPEKMVVTGNVSVKVDDPAKSGAALKDWVSKNGGSVSGYNEVTYEDEYARTRETTVTMTVRVADAEEAINYLENSPGDILSQDVQRVNVATQLADMEARIRSLEISISRLEEYLKTAENYNDLFQIERELTSRQGQLDSIISQQKILADQANLNTLTVEFVSTEKAASATDNGKKSFSEGLTEGWNSFVNFTQETIYSLASKIPWLILWIPLLLLGYGFWRLVGRRMLKKAAAALDDSATASERPVEHAETQSERGEAQQ